MSNEAARAYPIHIVGSSELPDIFETKLPWYVRFGVFIGTLMTQPANPKTWGFNPSVITLCLLIAGILTSGGWYIGHQAAIIEDLQKDSIETKGVAGKAESKSDYAVAKVDGGDGHVVKNPTPTPKQKVKENSKPVQGE